MKGKFYGDFISAFFAIHYFSKKSFTSQYINAPLLFIKTNQTPLKKQKQYYHCIKELFKKLLLFSSFLYQTMHTELENLTVIHYCWTNNYFQCTNDTLMTKLRHNIKHQLGDIVFLINDKSHRSNASKTGNISPMDCMQKSEGTFP